MIPPRVAKMLHRRLSAAAQAAVNVLPADADSDTGNSYVDTAAFVRNFKKLWLLSGCPGDSPSALNGPIFFLFWKNTSVTNVSLNELIALVRTHSQYSGHNQDKKLAGLINFQFASDAEYSEFIHNMWTSFFEDATGSEAAIRLKVREVCRHMTKNYALILAHTITFDYYFTSALLNIPMCLTVRLTELVANSGYIHSAGVCIYIRNSEKVSKSVLISSINSFLSKNESQKYYLVPYAEEFFGPWEKGHSASSLRNGLDGTRFHFRKHSVGKLTLQEILSLLPLETNNQVIVPSGLGQYWKEREEGIEAGASAESTIWFISDHNVHETDLPGYYSKGTKQYFIVYAQLIYNDNQLTLFKERKPAWTAPITLPHTLSTALVNIAYERWQLEVRARAGEESAGPPVIVDPFCGTGTTLIDAKRRFDDAIVIGLDRDPLAFYLCKDNLAFFSENAGEAESFAMTYVSAEYKEEDFVKALTSFVATGEELEYDGPFTGSAQQLLIFLSCALLSELLFQEPDAVVPSAKTPPAKLLLNPYFAERVQRVLDSGFSPKFRTFMIKSLGLQQRRLCYLIWRGLVYGRFSVSKPSDLFAVIEKELSQFAKESEQYVRSLKAKNVRVQGNYNLKLSDFSLGSSVDVEVFKRIAGEMLDTDFEHALSNLKRKTWGSRLVVCQVEDSAEALRKLERSVDIIITDPPYGFNTSERDLSLRDLFGAFFLHAVKSLKPRGQLVVALPDFARNGKHIPFYQTRTAVVQQVLSHAQSEGRRVLNFGDSVPSGSPLFRAPYYWTSTSGVSRSILHFTLD